MKKRLISLLIIGILSVSMLAGCGSTTPTDLPKSASDIEIVEQETEELKEVDTLPSDKAEEPKEETSTAESNDTTEVAKEEEEKLPKPTITNIESGQIREDPISLTESSYILNYQKPEDYGSAKLDIRFNGTSGIGSWQDEVHEIGILRSIDESKWLTMAIMETDWMFAGIELTEEEITKYIGEFNMFNITGDMEFYKDDLCQVVYMETERNDASNVGYLAVVYDEKYEHSWVIQILVNDEKDLDMAKLTAESIRVFE